MFAGRCDGIVQRRRAFRALAKGPPTLGLIGHAPPHKRIFDGFLKRISDAEFDFRRSLTAAGWAIAAG